MAECECLKTCPFFNDKMKDNNNLANMYKKRYCLSDNKECARYMIFKKMGKAAVPDTLYPNMRDRAKQIING